MNSRNIYKRFTTFGWALTLVGCALWTYGYFKVGSSPIVNWSAFSPHWISDYLANWQSEMGFLLTLLGSVPIYYVQIKTAQQAKMKP